MLIENINFKILSIVNDYDVVVIEPQKDLEISFFCNLNITQKIDFFLSKTNAKFLIVNLIKSNFIDSVGLGLLINVYKIYKLRRKKNGNVFCCNTSQHVKKLFEITALYKLYTIVDGDLDDTINIIKKLENF